LGMFSTSSLTPSGLAKARKCSTDVMAFSNFFSSNASLGLPRCCTRKRKGICSAISRAALDFVHGIDAAGTIGRGDVDRRRTGAAQS